MFPIDFCMTSHLPNTCFMCCPTQPPRFDYTNNVWCRVQIMKFHSHACSKFLLSVNIPWTQHWCKKNIRFPLFTTETLVNTSWYISSWSTKTDKQHHCTSHQCSTICRWQETKASKSWKKCHTSSLKEAPQKTSCYICKLFPIILSPNSINRFTNFAINNSFTKCSYISSHKWEN